MIGRREFIAGLGSAAAWPVSARAQQPAIPVVGLLSSQSAEVEYKNVTVHFLQGLEKTGYVEGQNVAVEYRYAEENRVDRLPELAADLVRRRVAVIVAADTAAALAAKATTTTIPIVFGTGGDPVALGLVASLNRPGGNLTGIANLQAELVPKRLQLLHELIPTALFGVLADPAFPPTPSIIADLQAAAKTLGRQLIVANARTDNDLEPAFATLSQQRVGAVLVGNGTLFARRSEQLAMLAARYGLPAIFQYREFAMAGGLMSYGPSLGYYWQQVGIYTGRILKGDKPADLPVQQVTKLDLVINLKTAKALGITIPETLLATADEVIQ